MLVIRFYFLFHFLLGVTLLHEFVHQVRFANNLDHNYELQSRKGKGDLAARMFEYFYKIYDKYKVPITAIAILTDGSKNYHPLVYTQEFLGTRRTYEFNDDHIIVVGEIIRF